MNTSAILQLNPQLCVRQYQGNPCRLVPRWQPRVVAPPPTAPEELWTMPSRPGIAPTDRPRPAKRRAAKIGIALLAILLMGVANLSVQGTARVEQQRSTYRMARELRHSEARSRLLASENRTLNAHLAMSEARTTSAEVLMAASAQPTRPARRKQI